MAHGGDLGGLPAPELVAVGHDGPGGVVQVWQGTGPLEWAALVSYSTVSRLEGGVLADVDGDAVLDLVAARGSSSIGVILGDGNGGFACERAHPAVAATFPELLAAGQLDGDGGADVVVGGRDSPAVVVFRAL